MYKGRALAAKVVDAGDAKVEVDPGDWAIVKVKEPIDLPALNVNLAYHFDFADPIFRLGNDYSKGIILSTGYVGQRTSNNLVTCLTDGHPGVSGGGVLNRERRAGRHSDRPDAGRLPLLVHPAAAAGDVPETSPTLSRERGLRPGLGTLASASGASLRTDRPSVSSAASRFQLRSSPRRPARRSGGRGAPAAGTPCPATPSASSCAYR